VASRRLIDRLLSPAGFGLALLLFLLPFLTVSCDVSESGTVVDGSAVSSAAAQFDRATFTATYTGLDLLTGGDPDIAASGVGADGKPQTAQADEDTTAQLEQSLGELGSPQPLAIVAALVILAAMLAALFAPSALRVPISAAAALAAIVLLLIEVVFLAPMRVPDSNILGLVDTAPRTRPGLGFYLSLAVLLAVLAWQFVVARRPPAPDDTEDAELLESDFPDFDAQPGGTGPP
jgi:hypothetical protein